MFELLYKYLILNKEASVPGIGTFVIERKPARLDFANKVFVSPAFEIGFNPVTRTIDNRMAAFISAQQKINEVKAVEHYYVFASGLKESLNKHQSVNLPGVGVLSQSAEGEIYFKEAATLHTYFPPVAAERILREHSEHNLLVGDINHTNTRMKEMLAEDLQPPHTHAKDPWWIFAIALGIIGIATIVYYYLHNGSLR